MVKSFCLNICSRLNFTSNIPQEILQSDQRKKWVGIFKQLQCLNFSVGRILNFILEASLYFCTTLESEVQFWDLVFFEWCWWPRESVLWGSSSLSEFRTLLSYLLTLWHCVKVKQRNHIQVYLSARHCMFVYPSLIVIHS